METTGEHNVLLISMLFLVWTTCSAAPMQCHFSSQALCEYEGKHYRLGDVWMEQDCLQCTCLQPMGVGCCETLHKPVDFPPWCDVRVESLTCRVFLVMRADPRLPCFPGDDNDIYPRQGDLNMKLLG